MLLPQSDLDANDHNEDSRWTPRIAASTAKPARLSAAGLAEDAVRFMIEGFVELVADPLLRTDASSVFGIACVVKGADSISVL